MLSLYQINQSNNQSFLLQMISKKLISDNLAVTAPSKPQEISAPAEQVTK